VLDGCPDVTKPQDQKSQQHPEPQERFGDLREYSAIQEDGVGSPAPHVAFSGSKTSGGLRIVDLKWAPLKVLPCRTIGESCNHDLGDGSRFISS
jgi:hypothetical protein